MPPDIPTDPSPAITAETGQCMVCIGNSPREQFRVPFVGPTRVAPSLAIRSAVILSNARTKLKKNGRKGVTGFAQRVFMRSIDLFCQYLILTRHVSQEYKHKIWNILEHCFNVWYRSALNIVPPFSFNMRQVFCCVSEASSPPRFGDTAI